MRWAFWFRCPLAISPRQLHFISRPLFCWRLPPHSSRWMKWQYAQWQKEKRKNKFLSYKKAPLSKGALDCRKTPRTVKVRKFFIKKSFCDLKFFFRFLIWYQFKAIDNTALWLPAWAALCRTSVRRRVRLTWLRGFFNSLQTVEKLPEPSKYGIFS